MLEAVMELINQLRAEHDLIEQVAGSLRTFVRQRARGEGDPADGARFMAFFRRYAGDFHHAREEDTLFVALTGRAQSSAGMRGWEDLAWCPPWERRRGLLPAHGGT